MPQCSSGVGLVEGIFVGLALGFNVGLALGTNVGLVDGAAVGLVDGEMLCFESNFKLPGTTAACTSAACLPCSRASSACVAAAYLFTPSPRVRCQQSTHFNYSRISTWSEGNAPASIRILRRAPAGR